MNQKTNSKWKGVIDTFLDELQRIKRDLSKEKVHLSAEMKKMPDSYIAIAKNRNHFNWYEVENGKRKYLSKKERNRAELLAQKEILIARQKDAERASDSIQKCMEIIQEEDLELNKTMEYLITCGLLQKTLTRYDNNRELQKWLKEEYQRNKYYPEKLIYRVRDGLYVRSKSEQTIALELIANQIPFRYECQLIVNGKSYYPDFTIMHPTTGKIYYWEHLGMMDEFKYMNGVYEKLVNYKEGGIIIGDNLIITFETKDKGLDAGYAETMISHFLR